MCARCFLPQLRRPLWDGWCLGRQKAHNNVETLCLFWSVWKVRNRIVFEDGVMSIQMLKASFVYLLWLETKLFIKDGPSTLIDFID